MANKGSAYERAICTQLSLWWCEDLDDLIFWRTAGSGARMTTRHKRGKKTKAHCGDIAAIDPIGKPFTDTFACEIKRGYATNTCAELLDKPDGAAVKGWEEWYQQVRASQARSGAYSWLLITKRDRREALVFLPLHTWKELVTCDPVPNLIFRALFQEPDTTLEVPIIGMHFETFLKQVPPEAVRMLHKTRGLNSD